jgi:plastocyanin
MMSGRHRARRSALPLAAALMLAWGSPGTADAVTGAVDAGKPQTHNIVIDGVRFEPVVLTVKRGDTVVWINKDPFPHTVTARGAFDSKSIAAGASWKHVARTTGEYDYVCTLHPNMKGTLKVE